MSDRDEFLNHFNADECDHSYYKEAAFYWFRKGMEYGKKKGFENGRHKWEVTWIPYGSSVKTVLSKNSSFYSKASNKFVASRDFYSKFPDTRIINIEKAE